VGLLIADVTVIRELTDKKALASFLCATGSRFSASETLQHPAA